MSTLRNSRRGGRDGERHGFTFFVIGAAVVLLVVFLIGMQVGRVVERGARHDNSVAVVKLAPGEAADPGREVRAFSEEPRKVAAVPPPPPSPVDEVRRTEKSVTFQETLPKKEEEIVPLARGVPPGGETRNNAPRPPEGNGGISVQAGAFRDPKAASAVKKKLEKAGYNVRISEAPRRDGGRIHTVIVGPFKDRTAARKAVRKMKQELKIHSFIVPGGRG